MITTRYAWSPYLSFRQACILFIPVLLLWAVLVYLIFSDNPTETNALKAVQFSPVTDAQISDMMTDFSNRVQGVLSMVRIGRMYEALGEVTVGRTTKIRVISKINARTHWERVKRNKKKTACENVSHFIGKSLLLNFHQLLEFCEGFFSDILDVLYQSIF